MVSQTSDVSHRTLLLTTKLHMPPARPELVPRPRLVERLNAGARAGLKLTLISAPAGYGKTTLVTAWLTGTERSFTWLSLDENDNDPSRFFTYLVAALQKIAPDIGQVAQALASAPQPPPPESLLTTLINDIAATPQPFVLVLDDYHLIHTLPIHQQLTFLLEHQPLQMHLVIVTRHDPPLPLSRLRARAQMTDIRQTDLQFTQEETRDFLRGVMGLDLAPADIAALQRRTEGWIAGLQLAAVSMRGRDDVHQLVQSFTGSQRYILDYLIDEVFQQQSADVRDFLLQTAILDRFTAPLCDAITEREDSQQVLRALEQANLFLIPLDESRQWYRYHHLFRDLLRTQRQTGDLAFRHHKAARWFESNGYLNEAVTHALAAQEWDEAGRVIYLAALQAIREGQFASLRAWLDAMPETHVRRSHNLATLKGWALLSTGQFEEIETWVELAEDRLPADASPLDRGALLCLRIYLAQGRFDIPRVIELAQNVLELVGDDDPYFLRGAALGNLAQAQTLLGDIPSATQTYRQMVSLGRQVGHSLSTVSALCSLAWFLHLQGQRSEAVALGQQALGECVDARGKRLPVAGLVHLILGRIHYDTYELAQAHQHLLQALELGAPLGQAGGALSAKFALAQVQQALGQDQASWATIQEVRQMASQFNVPQVDAQLAGAEADIQLKQGKVAAVERWAETAGLAPTDWPNHLREAEYFTYARLLLAQKRLDEAQTLLANFERFAQGGGRHRSLITVHVLQALSEQTLGREEGARACLEKAVRLAAPEGYCRAFVEGGPPVLELLPRVRPVAPDFVDQLLSRAQAERSLEKPSPPVQPLVEPLSERELQVLRLVADGLSNREIAERLIISVGTVKTHAHNIYGKLSVRGRTQAVARARELELL